MTYSRSRGFNVVFFGFERRNSDESRISSKKGERGMYVPVRATSRIREWRRWNRRGKYRGFGRSLRISIHPVRGQFIVSPDNAQSDLSQRVDERLQWTLLSSIFRLGVDICRGCQYLTPEINCVNKLPIVHCPESLCRIGFIILGRS